MTEENIIFTFISGGKTIVLDGKEYGIFDYEGIEATDLELEKEVNVNHIGERMRRKKILSRPVSVEFDYLGPDTEKSQKRQELIRFFSPFKSGEMIVNYLGVERKIEYEVCNFQIASVSKYDQLSCLLEIECLDPMFTDILQTGEQISTWINGWKWKFTLPFKLKVRGEQKKNIINSGHVETPVEIEFHGPAANPKIANMTTGEFIRIKRELTSDDTLYINTAFGQKKVEIIRGGIRENAFDYIDLASTFFSLQPGDNVIEYSCENGLDPQSVEIYYYNRYVGV